MKGILSLIGFAATIPAANWLIASVGWQFDPHGPHLIPVFPGLMAPSGVLMIGLALVLRDVVHEVLGARWAIVAILLGAALSWFVAPAFALASGAAFLASEAADFAVYAPLRHRHLAGAVMASGFVGAIVDSAAFLWLAFGSLEFLAGQVVGKLLMSAIVAIVMAARPTPTDGDPR